MIIGWPEGILLFLMVLGLGTNIAKHGELMERSAGASIIGFVLSVALLWWGGFFA